MWRLRGHLAVRTVGLQATPASTRSSPFPLPVLNSHPGSSAASTCYRRGRLPEPSLASSLISSDLHVHRRPRRIHLHPSLIGSQITLPSAPVVGLLRPVRRLQHALRAAMQLEPPLVACSRRRADWSPVLLRNSSRPLCDSGAADSQMSSLGVIQQHICIDVAPAELCQTDLTLPSRGRPKRQLSERTNDFPTDFQFSCGRRVR